MVYALQLLDSPFSVPRKQIKPKLFEFIFFSIILNYTWIIIWLIWYLPSTGTEFVLCHADEGSRFTVWHCGGHQHQVQKKIVSMHWVLNIYIFVALTQLEFFNLIKQILPLICLFFFHVFFLLIWFAGSSFLIFSKKNFSKNLRCYHSHLKMITSKKIIPSEP
jgi:hypothetical protein